MPAFYFLGYVRISISARHHRRMSDINPAIPKMQASILQASTALRFLGPGMTAAVPLLETTVIAVASMIYDIIIPHGYVLIQIPKLQLTSLNIAKHQIRPVVIV